MPLQIYTARISYSGPDRLDVTRKAGSVFGPSWALLRAGKSGEIDWQTYVEDYTAEMRWCWERGADVVDQRHRNEVLDRWHELLHRETVTLCCYCADPQRCHRTVLAGLLVKAGEHLGLPAVYRGERG